jgi:uncharacterized protein (TIGR02569 family)
MSLPSEVTPPPEAVLAAFGVRAEPARLPGGQGDTWRAGDIVLKPAEGTATLWRAAVLADLPESPGFRVARPLPTRDGGWIRDGWEAMWAVTGDADPRRVDDVVRAGAVFHQAVAAVSRPSFLDLREDPWAYADRLAWGEPTPPGATVPSPLLEPLLAVRRPVHLPAQIVHGDLAGNVLFADGLPPAIIDWAPYWRPPSWASAVAVIDALCWHGAPPSVIDRWAHLPEWGQMLIRALIYRIATWGTAGWATPPDSAYRPVVELSIAFAATGG